MRNVVASEPTIGASTRSEALAYLEQAEDFFHSATTSRIDAAKPLQLYYSYLNIAKAYILFRGVATSVPSIVHGLSEKVLPSGSEFTDAYVQFFRTGAGPKQAFDELMRVLNDFRPQHQQRNPIPEVIPQILPGHRLWADAAGKDERFIAIHKIQFTQNVQSHRVWHRIYMFDDDIRRLHHSLDDLLTKSRLAPDFKSVGCDDAVGERTLKCIEQSAPLPFSRHGLDRSNQLVSLLKPKLWVTVGSSPPYRRYYLYLCPPSESASLLSQIGSIYALTFYLGSVTRYRPNAFQALLSGPFGARIAEFVTGQAAQFVYLMTSEFARRDVTRPSIVV